MDYYITSLLLSLALAIFTHVFRCASLRRSSPPLPPGPRRFPVIGNILELGENPHQSLAKLSKKFGPLMSLKLGRITSIAISSPEFAKEALQKHGQALSGRPVPHAARPHDHHKFSVGWLPAAEHWRSLRKVMVTELFSPKKLEETQNLRRKKVQQMLDFVRENCENSRAIDVGQVAFTTIFNLMSTAIFSVDLASYNSSASLEFYDAIVGILVENGLPNVADYFPVLRVFDPQGIYRRAKRCYGKLVELFDEIVAERLQRKSLAVADEEKRDILDLLLNMARESLSLDDMKHLLMDIFITATDTTAKTLEWGMAELIRNPEKLAKLKNELKQIEGEISESEMFTLPYLQATVKEIYRLHPAGPFLVPHRAEYEVEIGGFKIPKDAQILVNVWAIGRDENIWKNPEKFEPERFLERKIDVKGRDFELIPFGAGKRICPGLPLAHRMVHFMLASLVQSFDWKLEEEIKPSELDMSEKFGLALSKAKPLLAVPCF